MDWAFIEHFLGGQGKLIALILTIVSGLIGLGAVAIRYLHDRYTDGRRAQEREENISKQKMLDEGEQRLLAKDKSVADREIAINKLRGAILGSDEALWRLHDPKPPPLYNDLIVHRAPPVIFVSNEKGGVGKSTITVNLAAHFALAQGMKVLVIDLDYHASTTKMLLARSAEAKIPSTLNSLLRKGASVGDFESSLTNAGASLPRLHIISAGETLSPTETKIQLDYLLQEPGEDVRYLLANLLICRRLREDYDIVFLDSPPRLTAAAVNGLCASTHILVPTKLDRVSAEAVAPFLNSVKALKAKVNPSLELLGVVANETDQLVLKTREKTERNVVLKQIKQSWGGNPVIFDRNIPHKAAIQSAASERKMAYLAKPETRDLFDKLGIEVGGMLGLEKKARVHESNSVAIRSA